MPKVKINGRDVWLPDSVTAEEEIRQKGGIRDDRILMERTPTGNFLVPKGSSMTINEGAQFEDAPPRIKGANKCIERRQKSC
jgi:hypothetical protein